MFISLIQINKVPLRKKQSQNITESLRKKQNELIKILQFKQAIWQDRKEGVISQKDYNFMRDDYDRQIEELEKIIERLEEEKGELEKGVDRENPFLATFRQYENISKLTREVLIDLVDCIKIYENGSISVKFKFSDELKRISEFIAINDSTV